tara:strand:+ start:317 stop:535 length:219 start_codon:yes stop_codon:yes gene_type:complete
MNKKIKIKITVNGKQLTIKPKFTLMDLIHKLKVPINKVAIELNREIVNKKKIDKIFIKSQDKIEIVHFIGGG